MNDRPRKHSLTLRGHRTSVSLEDDFWDGFRALAHRQKRALNDLAAEIDVTREEGTGLATAIRLYVYRAARNGASDF